jgi:uncharacterized protein with PIN domain
MTEMPRSPDRKDDGKAALFSSAVRRKGTLVVDCSRCHGRTRLTYAEFAQRHLPYWLWTPWRRFSRYMMCPACGRRAWVSARWFE